MSNPDPNRLLGYPDRFSVRPGQTIAFKISARDMAGYRADLVRVICGDGDPDGHGLILREVEAAFAGDYPAREQAVHYGSAAVIPAPPLLDRLLDVSLGALICPTLPQGGHQSILARWRADKGSGYDLHINREGCLAFSIGDGLAPVTASTGVPLRAGEWYFVCASFEQASGDVFVQQTPLRPQAVIDTERRNWKAGGKFKRAAGSGSLTIGAHVAGLDGERECLAGHFNGKIERPRLMSLAVGGNAMRALVEADRPSPATEHLVGAWDFSIDIPGNRIADTGPNRLDGTLVNMPTRAVTGHNWDASTTNWRQNPGHYGAIHFHADDLSDCGWESDFSFTVPEDLPSGLYAARLTGADDALGHVCFAVVPPRGKATAKAALLLSTATYMAYANSTGAIDDASTEPLMDCVSVIGDNERFLHDHGGLGRSTYDLHDDGSGIAFSSRLRPILDMRPGQGDGHALNFDSNILAWCERAGIACDVITDEDLHAEGRSLLDGYRVVMTGCHPEYVSTPMWDALDGWVQTGGRLMYLGGNGFYWRIAFNPDLPGIMEVRRGDTGTRAWEGRPGERDLAFTGEPGGLWRSLGRAPQRLTGVGFDCMMHGFSTHYRRAEGADDPRAAWILEGVDPEERIGDFGTVAGGAAGIELDRADVALGTPPHALVVARSVEHNENALLTPEEFVTHFRFQDGPNHPDVRADMVFYETPRGGAVFSVGSIAWPMSLAHNGGDNNVARITGNVLRRFLEPRPFWMKKTPPPSV